MNDHASSNKQQWMDDATCRVEQIPPELFFPGRGELIAPEVKDACRRCPVVAECRTWALHHEEARLLGGPVRERPPPDPQGHGHHRGRTAPTDRTRPGRPRSPRGGHRMTIPTDLIGHPDIEAASASTGSTSPSSTSPRSTPRRPSRTLDPNIVELTIALGAARAAKRALAAEVDTAFFRLPEITRYQLGRIDDPDVFEAAADLAATAGLSTKHVKRIVAAVNELEPDDALAFIGTARARYELFTEALR